MKVHADGRAVRHERAVGDPMKKRASRHVKGSMRVRVDSRGSNSLIRKVRKDASATHRTKHYVAVKLDSEADAREFAHAILNRKLTPDRMGEVVVIVSEKPVRRIALQELDRLRMIGQLGIAPRGSYLFTQRGTRGQRRQP